MGRKIPGLGDYLHQVRKQGKLLEINTFCDPILEMGEVAARWARGREPEKALLFKNTGTSYPVAMNLYGSRESMLSILRAQSYEAIEARIARLLRAASGSPTRIGKMLLETLWSRDLRGIIPRKCRGKAPCQEVVELTPNLHTLPLLQTWPADGGRFITLPMVITKSFSTGRRNVGMYRAQLFDGQTLGLHWHVHKTGAAHYREWKEAGECMPVAIVLGGDPLLAYCATAPLPDGIDEWMMAGFLRRRAVRQVRCVSIDLEVPAEADIVIEGYVDTAESLRLEGPFGDHTGFYSLADLYPVLHVTCIPTAGGGGAQSGYSVHTEGVRRATRAHRQPLLERGATKLHQGRSCRSGVGGCAQLAVCISAHSGARMAAQALGVRVWTAGCAGSR